MKGNTVLLPHLTNQREKKPFNLCRASTLRMSITEPSSFRVSWPQMTMIISTRCSASITWPPSKACHLSGASLKIATIRSIPRRNGYQENLPTEVFQNWLIFLRFSRLKDSYLRFRWDLSALQPRRSICRCVPSVEAPNGLSDWGIIPFGYMSFC